MNEENLFPNWFKTLFILIGAWSLSKEFARPIEVVSNLIIVVCYPLILLTIMLITKTKSINVGKGRYFFNISASIAVFFLFIIIADYRYYVEYIGKLLGGHFSILTDYTNIDYDEYGRPYAPDKVVLKNVGSTFYYYAAYGIYFCVLLYFVVGTWFLSNKIKSLADKNR